MHQQNTVIDIYNNLVCPSCKEFSVSPINSCNNGHIICGLCVTTAKICPTPKCKKKDFQVNAALELILASKGVEVPCRNYEGGCTLKIKPSGMIDHLNSSCDLRPMKCLEPGDPDCVNKMFKPKELFDHWVQAHRIFKREVLEVEGPQTLSSSTLLGTVTRTVVMTKKGYEQAMKMGTGDKGGWLVSYFELDGQTFFVQTAATKALVHMWITVLGMEAQAKGYKYAASLMSDVNKSNTSGNKQMTYSEIPVHSLRYYELEKVEAIGHTVAVSYSKLKTFQEKQPKDLKNMFVWDVEINIFKA